MTLPAIASAPLRKRVFTHLSVFRLPREPSAPDLDRIENADNDRLAFIGRAAIDYAFSLSPSDMNLDEHLANAAHEYDIVKHLQRAWIEAGPPTPEQATQLMEAYVGALVLESESDGMRFAHELVGGDRSPPSVVTHPVAPNPTGQLHDLATQRGIQLSWADRPEGPKHAQHWISDLTFLDVVVRGLGKSKKLARADAASQVLAQWDTLG